MEISLSSLLAYNIISDIYKIKYVIFEYIIIFTVNLFQFLKYFKYFLHLLSFETPIIE